MRPHRPHRRRRWICLLALLGGLALATSACNVTDPDRRALLLATGEVQFLCGFDCAYEGEAVNRGVACAVNVRGITRLFDSAGFEVGRDAWQLDPARRIRPGERFLFRGCCFTPLQVSVAFSSDTDIFWDDLDC